MSVLFMAVSPVPSMWLAFVDWKEGRHIGRKREGRKEREIHEWVNGYNQLFKSSIVFCLVRSLVP